MERRELEVDEAKPVPSRPAYAVLYEWSRALETVKVHKLYINEVRWFR